jgi:hypothetical protein
MNNDDNRDSGLIAGTAFLLIALVAWGFTSWPRFLVVLAFFLFLWWFPTPEGWIHAHVN